MFVRVVRFTDVTAERVESLVARIDETGPPPGTPIESAAAVSAARGDCGRSCQAAVADALVARRTAGVESGHRRRSTTTTSSIDRRFGHDPSSGSKTEV